MVTREYACGSDHVIEIKQAVTEDSKPFFRFCIVCGAKRKFERRIVNGHGGFNFHGNTVRAKGVRRGDGYTRVGDTGIHNVDYGRSGSDLREGRAREAAAIHNMKAGVAAKVGQL